MIKHITKSLISQATIPIRYLFCNASEYFIESKQFWRPPSQEPKLQSKSPQSVETLLLSYLLQHCPKNQPLKTLDFIDKYCLQSWMMNFGPQKRKIFEKVISNNKIKKVLQIGTYIGYSSLALSQCALQPQNKIVSLEINKGVAEIAKKILVHSGVKNVNIISENMRQAYPNLNELGPFDLVFMDQSQQDYIADLHFLQQRNLIRTGAIVIADNIIYPGAPAYLEHLKDLAIKKKYKSTLYHTYDAYTDIPDGVLVSHKIY